jgi:hypothetical protein
LRSRAMLGRHRLGLIIKPWVEAEIAQERLFWRGCSHF